MPATVRKRTWTRASKTPGSPTISTKPASATSKLSRPGKPADAWLVEAWHEVKQGVHTPEHDSITVAEAAGLWLARGELENLERSTLRQYRNHVDLTSPR
jgi:integrase